MEKTKHKPDDDHSEIQQMAVAGMLHFSKTADPLGFLEILLKGIDDKRFPIMVRPGLGRLHWEIQRSYDSKCRFLVYRIIDDIRAFLEPYTNESSTEMLQGIYQSVGMLKDLPEDGLPAAMGG